ncbi:GCN5 family acetyltransferase [Natrinema saccharevitans]|uniref:GCN5 family acetyltransferase n=1 Tax=Natrinema saccharevitans TaxID=301967 RepID=A0A1S8ATL0_9EURY|nr:GNAT family N-acetyltransferase [Natrinema saccharevitans]OLZ39926.1 GCN5 family acetyltransferase [Natrinema saccharevitans]
MSRTVRPATVDDVWAVHEIARESWHAAYDDVLGSQRVDAVVDEWYAIGDLESSIAAATGREDAAFLVAERPDDDGGDEPRMDADRCGFAHAVPWPEDTSVAFLARLYVHPAVWNEGVGTALLEALEAALAETAERLRLAVLAANDVGIAFYESRGFDRVGTRPSDIGDGLEEHVYERRLPDAA